MSSETSEPVPDQTLQSPREIPPSLPAENVPPSRVPPSAPTAPPTNKPAIPPAVGGTLVTGGSVTEVLLPSIPNVTIPGYEILDHLGHGGMGVVYKARQLKPNRIVALKMILANKQASIEDKVRFQIEVEAIAGLQHPNIVPLYEVGEHDESPFFSLEFCGGGSLAHKLKNRTLTPIEAARLIETLARAMHYAHLRGVVHRDLKPANVLLSADGTPKIADFGLAKRMDSVSEFSQTGDVMGTPNYMAPEQAAGRARDTGPGTDVYALGAILYELVAGQPPFRAETAVATIQKVMNEEATAPSRHRPGIPRDLDTICLKCLRKEPLKRYASAEKLAEDLAAFQAGKPISARPLGTLQRGWRWCRRNPALAGALTAVVVSLIAGSLTALSFAFRAEEARRSEATRAEAETEARRDAQDARKGAQRQLIDLSASSGLLAAKENDHALALLWFARAAQLADEEPQQQELNRIRLANWFRHVPLPEGTFTIPRFRPNQDRVRTLRFSPKGEHLLVVASTGDCLVWDRLRGRLISLPDSARKGVAAVWQPTGDLLAVAEGTGVIRLLAPPEFRSADEINAGQKITALAFSRDGKRLAWGGLGSARIWDLEKKDHATPLLAHGGAVASLSFSANGELLATSAGDGKARVFRVAPDTLEPLFPPVNAIISGDNGSTHGGTDQVAPRFAANDQTLLTVERNQRGNACLAWRNATTGKLLSYTDMGHSSISAFALVPQGDILAVFWSDGGEMGRLLDTRSGSILAAIPTKSGGNEDIAFTADGKTLVVGNDDRSTQFWSVEDRLNYNLAISIPRINHPTVVVRVSLTSDDRHLADAQWDGTISLWRLPSRAPVTYSIPAASTTFLALSPDGKFVLPRGTSYRFGTLLDTRAYHAESGEEAGPKLDPGGILLDAVFSPDGKKVATASSTARTPQERATGGHALLPDGRAGNVQIWDWKGGKRLAGPLPMPGEPRGLAFHPDGRTLAVVCADYRVVLLNAETGTITQHLDPGLRSRPSLPNFWTANGEARFSPDGRFLITWELGTTVHVWDPMRGKLLHSLAHNARIDQVCFNLHEPRILATGGRERTMRLWNLDTGTLVRELHHPFWCFPIQFSPDGTELITVSDLVRVWDWRAGKLRDGVTAGNSKLTSDHRWLFAFCPEAGGAKQIELIDWRTKAPAGPRWKSDGGPLLDICIPADGRRAIVTGFSRPIVGYDLEAMVTPASGRIQHLMQLAELAAGRRILDQGRVVPLTQSEWSERWQQLQRTGHPVLP